MTETKSQWLKLNPQFKLFKTWLNWIVILGNAISWWKTLLFQHFFFHYNLHKQKNSGTKKIGRMPLSWSRNLSVNMGFWPLKVTKINFQASASRPRSQLSKIQLVPLCSAQCDLLWENFSGQFLKLFIEKWSMKVCHSDNGPWWLAWGFDLSRIDFRFKSTV